MRPGRRFARRLSVACVGILFSVAVALAVANAQGDAKLSQAISNCERGDLQACNSVGFAYDLAGQPALAVKYFRIVCDGGQPVGCANLAEFYYDGRGVPQNRDQAAELFKSSCGSKSVSGCPGVCIMLFDARNGSMPAACPKFVQAGCDSGNSWLCPHAKRLLAGSPAPRAATPPPTNVPVVRGVCSDESARLIARAYYLSNPMTEHDGFQQFVTRNRAVLSAGSPAIQCGRVLGAHLAQRGINAYDADAYRRAMGKGPDELAPDVARSFNSGAVDVFAMGRELVWLAEVLPAAAVGDFGPYVTAGTETRAMLRQVLALAGSYAAIPEFAQMLGMTKSLVPLFEPISEGQILMLAQMLPR